MVSPDIQRLWHIKTYCEEIAATLQRFGAVYEIYANDMDYQKSIAMSIMQIGELSAGLSDEFKKETRSQMPWGLIRGMRNLFAHAYISMNKADVWDTATNDIPELLLFCNKIIEQSQEE